jgi:hypothetical protein
MRVCERLKAVRKSALKGRQVGRIARGLMRYGCDNREHVLDAMIGLLKEPALPLRPSLPLADVTKKTDKERIAELIAGGD